jgi:hypothetical protein
LRDWQYLEAFEELTRTNGRFSCAAIANLLPKRRDPESGEEKSISSQAVWKALRRPGFMEWLRSELRRATDDKWELLCARNMELALRGSIDHANWIAKVRGIGTGSDGTVPPGAPAGGQVLNNNGIIVHVHE